MELVLWVIGGATVGIIAAQIMLAFFQDQIFEFIDKIWPFNKL